MTDINQFITNKTNKNQVNEAQASTVRRMRELNKKLDAKYYNNNLDAFGNGLFLNALVLYQYNDFLRVGVVTGFDHERGTVYIESDIENDIEKKCNHVVNISVLK